jgi:CBS domain containing-hemolysin-like protein
VFAPERVPLDRLLALFREQRSELVFLVDEYGGVEGIVTQQDVVDELLGDAAREAGPTGGALVVAGDTPLHDLAQLLGRPQLAATGPAATVGGLVVNQAGRVPRAGEAIEVEGVALQVVESDGRAVRSVRATLLPAGPSETRP